jgi:hypothetical protein
MYTKKQYTKIFDLIDDSNRPDGTPGKEAAEAKLVEMGIYAEEGELVIEDDIIWNYYEDNWC